MSDSIIENKSSIDDEKRLKIEFKREKFNKEFRSLIEQSREIINTKFGRSIEFGKITPELICLDRYLAIYNNTTPQEHYTYFETLFNRKRNEILNFPDDDQWIRSGKIIIQFGEGIKSTKEIEQKRKQVRIEISAIFLMACDLQLIAEKALDGIDEKFADQAGGKDLIRPNIILLHLMRIFYYLNDTSDKSSILIIVNKMEELIGATKTGEKISPQIESNANQTSSGLSGIFTMATSMMEKFGIKPPPGMKPPTDADISNVMENVFTNANTQNAISTMFTQLNKCENIGEVVQEVVKNVTEQKTMNAIHESIIETTNKNKSTIDIAHTAHIVPNTLIPNITQILHNTVINEPTSETTSNITPNTTPNITPNTTPNITHLI